MVLQQCYRGDDAMLGVKFTGKENHPSETSQKHYLGAVPKEGRALQEKDKQ